MNKIKWNLILFLATGFLFFSSCEKSIEVVPSGNTNSVTSANYIGTWYNNENSSVNGAATYHVAIEAPDSSTIIFAFLYGFHSNTKAKVDEKIFRIYPQIIEGNNVSGSGVLANSKQINMTYYVNNGLYIDTVAVVLTL